MPSRGELYPPDFSTVVEIAGVSEGGEGAMRPGHFRGVATVVLKLFLRVLPDVPSSAARTSSRSPSCGA